jgi:hypothetical protein
MQEEKSVSKPDRPTYDYQKLHRDLCDARDAALDALGDRGLLLEDGDDIMVPHTMVLLTMKYARKARVEEAATRANVDCESSDSYARERREALRMRIEYSGLDAEDRAAYREETRLEVEDLTSGGFLIFVPLDLPEAHDGCGPPHREYVAAEAMVDHLVARGWDASVWERPY